MASAQPSWGTIKEQIAKCLCHQEWGRGMGGRTTGIIYQKDTGQKEVVWESLLAALVSERRLGIMGHLTGLWSLPMPSIQKSEQS